MKTLFIGNSHTYYNDMPSMFKDICKENGIDMHVTMLTKGGMGLDYHADNEQTRFNILFGEYDYIILQHVAHPMGEFSVMDEALGKAIIDVSGRPFIVFDAEFTGDKCGEMDTQLFEEFFRSFAFNAGITLHISAPYGVNDHHKAEAMFKALARALRMAVEEDPRFKGQIVSTKGSL